MPDDPAVFTDKMDPSLKFLGLRPRDDWEWGFDHTTTSHSPVNAVALLNVAMLAYSGQNDVRRFLQKWGMTDIRCLQGPNSQGFVARRDGAVFVSFRGTEPSNRDDWRLNFAYHQAESRLNLPGLVHGGFATALAQVMDQTIEAISNPSDGTPPSVFVTGHSLGGALAVLAAAVLKKQNKGNVAAVYTYGQPRVGDANFGKAYDADLGDVTFRYVNDFDIVPHLPPAWLPAQVRFMGWPTSLSTFVSTMQRLPRSLRTTLIAVKAGERFTHVGRLMLLLPDGTISDKEADWQAREITYSGSVQDLLKELPGILRYRLGQALNEPGRLLDHDPLRGYLPGLESHVT